MGAGLLQQQVAPNQGTAGLMQSHQQQHPQHQPGMQAVPAPMQPMMQQQQVCCPAFSQPQIFLAVTDISKLCISQSKVS
eukprot:scaffold681852_cov60-Prasinocladus_malaysianus.AAC.1